jgi:hypothetical protein
MRNILIILLGTTLWQNSAIAQSTGTSGRADGVTGQPRGNLPSDYAPLTASERWKLYFLGAFGPGAILRAGAVGGIRQWQGTPKEWRGGPEAYGDRFGSAIAQHVIQKTIESAAAAVLNEDNRYIRSTETGFWRRTKYAVGSVFVARNNAGQEHFAYSRFGGTVSAAFISRIWQPHSTNTSGDAAVSFGYNMALGMGWNVWKEFAPRRFRRK